MPAPANPPRRPDVGPNQETYWDDEYGFWKIRDKPTPPAAPPPPAARRAVMAASAFQLREALDAAGRLAAWEAWVASDGTPTVQRYWAHAPFFRRASPHIAAIAAGIGLNDAQLDRIFDDAANL